MKMNSKCASGPGISGSISSSSDPKSSSHRKALESDQVMGEGSIDAPVNLRGESLDTTVTKSDRQAHAAGSTSQKLWDPWHPEIGLDKLVPSALAMNKIELQDCDYKSSTQCAEELRRRGDNVVTIPFKHYRANTYVGQIRQLDNLDCLRGKEPIYGDLANFLSVRRKAQRLQQRIAADLSDSEDLAAKCEMEDNPKICMQQWKQPGWWLDSPITDAEVPLMTEHHEGVANRVASVYKAALPREFDTKDFRWLCLQDYDPDDTMTGAPTFASGAQTHEARVALLAALPVPGGDVQEWYHQLLTLQSQIGWPDPMMYSSVVATRFGPRVKPMRLWRGSDGYMESSKESVGAYNRVRFVYPAPYGINYLWSAIYEQLSHCRMNILGLWHDPVSQDKYIDKLKRQGKYSYAVDFSGMDTGMFPRIILTMVKALIKAGFVEWPLKMMQLVYPHMGIIFPSLEGGVENVSVVTGPSIPWCSGFKLTSEMDTLYGLCVILDSLSQQIPRIFDLWASGSFTIAELGDDIIFTCDVELDTDALADYALKTWGAKLKVNRDVMFLKWMLPLCPSVKVKSRTFSRVMQQTLYNEDRYSGVEGGTRPDAVLRLALKARMVGLDTNPYYQEYIDDWIDIVQDLSYVKTAPSAYVSEVLLGEKLCLDEDVVEIYKYARSNTGYYLDLAERSKYEPSAAFLKSLWDELNVPVDATPALEIRKIYDRALFSEPTRQDVFRLMQWTNACIM